MKKPKPIPLSAYRKLDADHKNALVSPLLGWTQHDRWLGAKTNHCPGSGLHVVRWERHPPRRDGVAYDGLPDFGGEGIAPKTPYVNGGWPAFGEMLPVFMGAVGEHGPHVILWRDRTATVQWATNTVNGPPNDALSEALLIAKGVVTTEEK